MNILINRVYYSGIIAALLLISSCASLTNDIYVKSHTNPKADFSAYQSYTWSGSAQIVFDPLGQWAQPTLNTDEEVRFNINRELRKRGLFESDQNPDLIVAYAAGIDMTTLKLKEDPESNSKILKDAPKAALLIAIVDARTGYVVWLGYAEGKVQGQQSIENIRVRIEYAVSEVFKSFNN